MKKYINPLNRSKYFLGAMMFVCSVFILFNILNLNKSQSYEYLRDGNYWQEQIKKLGDKSAYSKLIVLGSKVNSGEQHMVAHTFGGALFKIEGPAGISVCDNQFSSGCFHEVVGLTIKSQGINSIKGLNDKCLKVKEPYPCQHGIGHGILGYLGYDNDALIKALEVCSELRKTDYESNCSAGVFMEYNLRIMIDKSEPRFPTDSSGKTDWLYPCDTVAADSRIPLTEAELKSCVLILPQWWWVVATFKKPIELKNQDVYYKDLFIDMGKRCRMFGENSVLRNTCFGGIGQTSPAASNYDRKMPFNLCKIASENQSELSSCEAFVVKRLKQI